MWCVESRISILMNEYAVSASILNVFYHDSVSLNQICLDTNAHLEVIVWIDEG